MPAANDLRRGMAIKYNGNPAIVLEVHHRTPGNLRAFVQAIIRYINTGKSADVRFGSTDKVELVDIERKQLEFSYKDRNGYYFMDPETYDTITLAENLIGEANDYLVENLSVQVLYAEGKAVQVELPASVSLKVVESPEGLRGASRRLALLLLQFRRFCLAFVGANLRNLRQLWLQRSADRKRIAVRAIRSAAGKLSAALRARHREASSRHPSRSQCPQSG